MDNMSGEPASITTPEIQHRSINRFFSTQRHIIYPIYKTAVLMNAFFEWGRLLLLFSEAPYEFERLP